MVSQTKKITDTQAMEMCRFVNTPFGYSILFCIGTQMSDEDWMLLKQRIENERLMHKKYPGKHESD